MVYVYTACCSANRLNNLISNYKEQLPAPMLQKAKSFRYEIDSCRYLLGKILLVKGIGLLGYGGLTLEHLQVSTFNKPYFINALNFNISHSGNYVLCAISEQYKVGIDVEEMNAIDITEFARCFTAGEWAYINNSTYPIKTFYSFWTRKEAVIKADGRGLQIPLLSFDVLQNCVTINTNKWYIQELGIAEGYCTHLVTDGDLKNDYSIQQII